MKIAYKQKDRVAVEYEGGVWAIGTVIKVERTSVTVLEDDGDIEEWNTTKDGIRLLDPTIRKFKKPMRINKLEEVIKSKTSYYTGEYIDEETTELAETHGLPAIYAKALNDAGKLKYLEGRWNKMNADFFQSQMNKPRIKLLDREDLFGLWESGLLPGDYYVNGVRKTFRKGREPTLSISKRVFNGEEGIVLTTLLHEMCHEAVSELSNIVELEQGGHGPEWQRWMRKVGLTPARYVKQDEIQHIKSIEGLYDNLEEQKDFDPLDPDDMEFGTNVKWYSKISQGWKFGILIGKIKPGKWLIASEEIKGGKIIVPWAELGKISPKEQHKITPKLYQFAESLNRHLKDE